MGLGHGACASERSARERRSAQVCINCACTERLVRGMDGLAGQLGRCAGQVGSWAWESLDRNGVGGINPRSDWAWRGMEGAPLLASVLHCLGELLAHGGATGCRVGGAGWRHGGGSHDDGPNRSGRARSGPAKSGRHTEPPALPPRQPASSQQPSTQPARRRRRRPGANTRANPRLPTPGHLGASNRSVGLGRLTRLLPCWG